MEKSERKIVLVLVFLTIIMGALVVFFCAKADSYRKDYDDALKKAKDFVVARYEPGAETDRIQVLGGSLGYDYKILSSEGEVVKDVYVDNSESEEHVNAAIRAEDEEFRVAVYASLSLFVGAIFALLLISYFIELVLDKVKKILYS